MIMQWVLPVDVQEGPYDTWALWVAVGAALATFVSAIVVGIQAVQTAKSTAAAVRAAKAAVAGLEFSERSAAAAVDAARTSKRMFEQGERNRRDAATPKLLIHTETHDYTLFDRIPVVGGAEWDPLLTNETFPFDNPDVALEQFREVGVRFPLVVVNDGPGSVLMWTVLDVADASQAPVSRGAEGLKTWVIRPQEMLRANIYWYKMINNWGSQADRDDLEEDPLESILEFVGGSTEVMTETWRFRAEGMAMTRSQSDKHALVFSPRITSSITRVDRSYGPAVQENLTGDTIPAA